MNTTQCYDTDNFLINYNVPYASSGVHIRKPGTIENTKLTFQEILTDRSQNENPRCFLI